MIINVGQLIFGNVEKELSPKKVAGIQTLFHTESMLSQVEVEEIESRLVYYAGSTEPVKLLFFLVNNKYLISRIIPQRQTDKFGRENKFYLAHCFIFTEPDFFFINNNPFVGFRLLREKCASSLEEALKFDHQGTNIENIKLDVAAEQVDGIESELAGLINNWPIQGLRQIYASTVSYQELHSSQKSLSFYGPAAEIQNGLTISFLMLPVAMRKYCSFDTHFLNCNVTMNYYWSRSFPEMRDIPANFIAFDAAAKKAQESLPVSSSPYQNWLFGEIAAGRFSQCVNQVNNVTELSNLLLSKSFIKRALIDTPDLIVADFISSNGDYLKAKVQKNLADCIGPALAQYIIIPEANIGPKNQLYALEDGFTPEPFIEPIKNIFWNTKPNEKELIDLEKFALKTHDSDLQIIMLRWKNDFIVLRQKLYRLSREDFKTKAEVLVKQMGLPPSELICPGRADIAVQLFFEQTQFHTPDEYFNMVFKLIDHKEFIYLVQFEGLLNKINREKLISLLKKIDQEVDFPQSFKNAVQQAAKYKNPAKGFQKTENNVLEPESEKKSRGFWGFLK